MLALQFEPDNLDEDGGPVSRRSLGEWMPGSCRAWERLGVGHRCETWLAWSPQRWCPAVVKLPRPHQVGHPGARGSLRREVAALTGNLHPALPRLFEDGSDATLPYLVFEHVDGIALDVEIDERGALAESEVALLGTQLFAALHAVHARGLAHVDVKPENVVLRDGRPVLLDFGSARALGSPQPAGHLIGSPGYASPDLEAGEPISAAMDVYGLGVALYETLSGQMAFDPAEAAAERPAPPGLPHSPLGELVLSLVHPDPRCRPDVEYAWRTLAAISAAAGRPACPAWALQ